LRRMSYTLKTIRYHNEQRKILLQNKNGPCPLLAAANALLLRGVITLPPCCIETNEASTEDIVNTLAERALNTTANHGLQRRSSLGDDGDDGGGREYQINELLGIFPNLQFGMDVNPRLTRGVTGVEYTKNLTAFDLMGVELVHGWLVDPNDVETVNAVGGRTYNELMDSVISGDEARDEVDRLEDLIRKKQKALEAADLQSASAKTDEAVVENSVADTLDLKAEAVAASMEQEEEWVRLPDVTPPSSSSNAQPSDDADKEEKDEEDGDEKMDADKEEKDEEDGEEKKDVKDDVDLAWIENNRQKLKEQGDGKEKVDEDKEEKDESSTVKGGNIEEQQQQINEVKEEITLCASKIDSIDKQEDGEEQKDAKGDIKDEVNLAWIEDIRQKLKEQQERCEQSTIINTFVTDNRNQLTAFGLTELHSYVKESCTYVFFRNNHFATMTKEKGVLYLLVTDLGYANVNEVVWERLDDITGDTQYMDCLFQPSKPRSQSEIDLQVALRLSRDDADGNAQEEKQMDRAKEASMLDLPDSPSRSVNDNELDDITKNIQDVDEAVAKRKRDEEAASELLARRLQAEEDEPIPNFVQRGNPNTDQNKGSCMIS